MHQYTKRALAVVLQISILASCARLRPQPTPTTPSSPTATVVPTEVYTLRTVSAAEYLAAIPVIVEQMRQTDSTEYQQGTNGLRTMISAEVKSRYPDLKGVSLKTLCDAEPSMVLDTYWDTVGSEKVWRDAELKAWLTEAHPNLTSRNHWTYCEYSLDTTPIDFNGDGISEVAVVMTLQPREAEYPLYTEYLVLGQNDKGEYEQFPKPSLWRSAPCSIHSPCGGSAAVIGVRDLTGDGLPEWLLTEGQCAYGICGVGLFIVSWQNGRLINLTPESGDEPFVQRGAGGGGAPSSPPPGTWSYENLDVDPATEIVQRDTLTDNRGCEFVTTQIFDLDSLSAQYVGNDPTYSYADTPACALRLAHNAMIAHEFNEAIKHYEHFLRFDLTGSEEASQYVEVRLATAYALTGQSNKANKLLTQLRNAQPIGPIMNDMLSTAPSTYLNSEDPFELCATLYKIIRKYDSFSVEVSSSDILNYGQTNDYNIALGYGGGDYSPAYAGCDIPGLWDDAVTALKLNQPIEPQLEQMGWRVGGHLEADLNNDGTNETLVWPTALPSAAVLRWSGQGTFHDAVVANWPPTQATNFGVISLQDGAHKLLAASSFDPDASTCCESDCERWPGYVRVMRLGSGGLQEAGSLMLCSAQTLDQIFATPNEMHIESSEQQKAAVLVWDAKQLKFVKPEQVNSSNIEQSETEFNCYGNLYSFCEDDYSLSATLVRVDSVLVHPPADVSHNFLMAFRYYRATLLEDLGRDSEALAQYVALYQDQPESAWGMLAKLHFQP